MLEALAKLTGAINQSNSRIDSSQGPADQIAPGDPLFFKIESILAGDTVAPSIKSMSDGIRSAMGAVLGQDSTDIETALSNNAQSQLKVVNASGSAYGVSEGQIIDFNISVQASNSGANDLLFIDQSKGWLLGSIPVIAQSSDAYRRVLTITDPDNEAVTVHISKAELVGSETTPVDARIEVNGSTQTFVFNPTQIGDYEFAIVATDAKGASGYKTFKVTVTASNSNNLTPYIEPIAGRTIQMDTALSIPVIGSDPEGNALSYYLYGAPQGMTLKASGTSGATISWRPTREQLGDLTVTVVAIDHAGGQVRQNFSISVTPPTNTAAPVVISPLQYKAIQGQLFNAQFSAVDVDGGDVIIQRAGTAAGSPIALPDEINMHLDPSGGFNWTPKISGSNYTVQLEAVDTQGAITPFTVTINVLKAPANPPANVSYRGDFADGTKTLTWTPSTSSGVTGYNVYFAPLTNSTGVPDPIHDRYAKLNPSPITVTNASQPFALDISRTIRWDSNKQYSFYVKAINADGIESNLSEVITSQEQPSTPAIQSISVTKLANGSFVLTPVLSRLPGVTGGDTISRDFVWTSVGNATAPTSTAFKLPDTLVELYSTVALAANTTYIYELKVVDTYSSGSPASEESIPLRVTIDTSVVYPPYADIPANLVVAALNATTSVRVGQITLLDNSSPNPTDYSARINWGNGAEVYCDTPVLSTDVNGRTVVSFFSTSPFTSQADLTDQNGGEIGNRTATLRIFRGAAELGTPRSVPVQVVSELRSETPTNITATVVSSGIILKWDNQKDSTKTLGYKIYRVDSDGNGVMLPAPLPNGRQQVTTSNPYFDNSAVAGKTYSYFAYRAELYSVGSVEYLNLSEASNAAAVKTWAAGALAEADEISAIHTRSWDKDQKKYVTGVQIYFKPALDLVGNIGGYYIDRAVNGVFPANPSTFNVVDPTGPLYNGKLGFFDDSVTFNGTDSYLYRIRTVAADGTTISTGVQFKALRDITPPSRPTNLKAVSYADAMQLTWDDRSVSDDADWAGWNIYRKVGNGTLHKLNTQPINDDTGFNDYGAPTNNNVLITYELRSVDLLNNESAGISITKKRSIDGEPPAPTPFVALPVNSSTISLTWGRVTPTGDGPHDGIVKYQVYRSTNPDSDGSQLVTLPGSGSGPLSYSDTISSGNAGTYYYSVRAVDGDGDESSFTRAQRKLGDGKAPPAPAPATVTSSDLSDTHVTLAWPPSGTPVSPADSSDDAVGYLVFRSTNGGPKEQVGTQIQRTKTNSSDREKILDDSLVPASTYTYSVYAIDDEGDISAAATTTVTTPGAGDQQPKLLLTSPAIAAGQPLVVTSDIPVRGIIDDPNNDLKQWYLVLRPQGASPATINDQAGPKDIIIAEGTTERGSFANGTDALLGAIKPTTIPDGLYNLVLIANDLKRPPVTEEDPGAQEPNDVTEYSGTTPQTIQIQSTLKTGNFVLPAVDLQVDSPTGQSITVTRTYDSSSANENGDFGNGWSLNIADTDLRTTMRNSSLSTKKTMRAGDLVYITLPGEGQHVFQFMPRPTSYNYQLIPDPMSPWYEGSYYAPMFVAVDGSDAVLTLAASDEASYLIRRLGKEFFFDADEPASPSNLTPFDSTQTPTGINGKYYVKTGNGTVYTVNAGTGALEQSKDAQGHETSYSASAGGFEQTGSEEFRVLVARDSVKNRINDIYIKRTQPGTLGYTVAHVHYSYNETTGDLTKVEQLDVETNAVKQTTNYGYDPDRPHFLTRVIDPRNPDKNALSAVYNKKTGLLVAIKDASDTTIPIQNGSFDGETSQQAVKDPAGNDTESVYDEHGNVIRQVQTIYNSDGVVDHFVVTIKKFSYLDPTPDARLLLNYGISTANVLSSMKEYRPFTVAADQDPYSVEASEFLVSHETAYFGAGAEGGAQEPDGYFRNYVDPNFRHIKSDTVYAQNGTARTTYFDNYKLGRPQKVTDPDVHVTWFNYDDAGNLRWTVNALGEGTKYTYATTEFATGANYVYAVDGTTVPLTDLPVAAVLESFRITCANPEYAFDSNPNTNPAITVVGTKPQSANYYYGQGADAFNAKGKLKATIDAAGRKTAYVYDGHGRIQYTATLWKNPNPGSATGQQNRWVVSSNTYDYADRVIKTEQFVYEDSDVTTPNAAINDSKFGFTVTEDGTVTLKEGLFTAARTLSQTSYDALGKVKTSTDQYGGVTTNFYDARGMLVRTTYPDGTESRSVYDAFGRVILTMDRYKPVGPEEVETAMSTRTIYDAQGRVSDTQRLVDASITILQDGSKDIYNVTDVGGAGIEPDPQTGAWQVWNASGYISHSQSLYDGSGQVVESINNDGLRTGTIYYPNGQVRYTGVLKSSVTGSWWANLATDPTPGSYFDSYTTYLYDQGNSSGRYDEVIDALGHSTKTYKDELGRAVKTIYADDSFTETAYGYYNSGNDPLTSLVGSTELTALAPVTWVKSIEQRPSGSSATAAMTTIRYYDNAGRLVIVLQPDADGDGPLTQAAWRYRYDNNGNQSTQTDPKGHVTSFEYDEFGQQTKRTLPAVGGNTVSESWKYDSLGRLLWHKDFKQQTTWYRYDESAAHGGRLTGEYRYTADVTPIASDDPATFATAYDEKTLYIYDDDAAVPAAQRKMLGRQYEVQEWGARGSTSSIRTKRYAAYDEISGGVTQISMLEGTTVTSTINYVYDPVSGRLIRTYTSNNDTAYGYDQQGRLDHVYTLKLNGGTALGTYSGFNATTHQPTYSGSPLITTYAYDAVGNLLSTVENNGTATTTDDLSHGYQYDNLNRLNIVTVTRGAANLFKQEFNYQTADHKYEYEADGQRGGAKETRYNSDGTIFSTTYIDWEYDALNRLTKETYDTDGSSNDYTAAYTFDLVGNRIKKAQSGYQAATTVSSFNERDQLTASGADSDNDWVPDPSTATVYVYDPNGSTTKVTNSGGSKLYLWDLRNRMVGYDANGDDLTFNNTSGSTTGSATAINDAGDARFTYDSDSVRLSRTEVGTSSNTVKEYLQDTNNPTGYSQVLEERKNGTLDRSYIIGQSVLGQKDSSGTRLFASDGHGSTRVLINPTSSTPVQNYEYDAYGNALLAASSQTPILYTNQLFDPIVNEYLLRARYYNQVLGTFSSFDVQENSTSDPLHLHKYLYCSNSPIYMIDPSGHDGLGSLLVGFGIRATLFRIGVGASLGVADAYFRGYSYTTGAIGGAVGGLLGPLIPIKLGLTLGAVGVLDALVAGEYDSALFRAATLGFGFALQTKGFSSFRVFKDFFGPAGKGKAWHHIVEQYDANVARFGAEAIHNPTNVVPVAHGAGTVHAKINGLYSSNQPYITGPGFRTVRQWLATKSYAEQYQFGLEAMQRFGAGSGPMNVQSATTGWSWPAVLEPIKEVISAYDMEQ